MSFSARLLTTLPTMLQQIHQAVWLCSLAKSDENPHRFFNHHVELKNRFEVSKQSQNSNIRCER